MHRSEELKEKLKNGEPIRVVIYGRASTDNEAQKDTCEHQVALAMSFIKEHSNLELVHEPLVDDGISGTDESKRPEYQELKRLIASNSFDLLMTKQFSRLNRNEANAFMLMDLLEEHNISVLTLLDYKIHDLQDPAERMFLAINFSMDASYSSNVRAGQLKYQEQKREQGILDSRNISYGYDWHKDDKTITINEEQADVIRRIFEEYVYRNGTPASIQRMLDEKGISICSRSVQNILKDERYIGIFYLNTRTTEGQRQFKKRVKLPKEEWVPVERPDLRIIDDDLFEMAQRIHRARITVYEKPDKKTTQAHFQGTHIYAGKIFCPVCGKPYQYGYADRKKTLPIYRIKSHSDCPNPIRSIYESDLEAITKQALKQTIDQQNEVCTSLERILTEIVENSQNNGAEIDKLKKQRSAKQKEVNRLTNAISKGILQGSGLDAVLNQINSITAEADRLTELIQDKETNKLDESYVSEKLTSIRAAIADLRNFTSIDRDRILNYIDRIDMPPNGDIEIYLMSGQVITIKQQSNSDFSDGNIVGTMGNQDAQYSWLAAYQLLRRL